MFKKTLFILAVLGTNHMLNVHAPEEQSAMLRARDLHEHVYGTEQIS
eukprot:SAG11_NODE_1822_length_4207_cov_1.736125_2_plen_47_part_00